MRCLIVSDLHIDINKNANFGFRNLHDIDVILIAGDIAGSYQKETKFLKNLSKQMQIPIYAIAGNHLGYEYYTREEELDMFLFNYKKSNPLEGTKQYSIDYIKENTPENVFYLDNEYIDLGEYILFGGCMYSDYKLYPNIELSKKSGEQCLNDFRYVHIYDKKMNIVRLVNTDDYQEYHKVFIEKLEKCIKETNKDIIVLSHFAPSIKSIAKKYLKGNIYLNASYCSDMEDFILNNPKIKYWIHGHMHDSFDYMVGQCRIICEPFGYKYENKLSLRKWLGKIIEI